MNYDQLRLKIQNSIKGNASREITGFLLQEVLLSMVDILGADIISMATGSTGKATDSDKLGGYPASHYATATSVASLENFLTSMWGIDEEGNLVTERNVISLKEISAGGAAEEGEEGEGGTTTGEYKMYHHSQGTAAKEWRVEHGLGKYPNVRIVDSNKMLCYGDVKYVNDSVLTITFGAAEKGDAYCD